MVNSWHKLSTNFCQFSIDQFFTSSLLLQFIEIIGLEIFFSSDSAHIISESFKYMFALKVKLLIPKSLKSGSITLVFPSLEFRMSWYQNIIEKKVS